MIIRLVVLILLDLLMLFLRMYGIDISLKGSVSYTHLDVYKRQLQLSSDCLNEVRERAGGTAFRIESSDLTLALLQNERKIELAFEDHRFYDLKRWRIADQIWSCLLYTSNRNKREANNKLYFFIMVELIDL